jgi:hypothetical protein
MGKNSTQEINSKLFRILKNKTNYLNLTNKFGSCDCTFTQTKGYESCKAANQRSYSECPRKYSDKVSKGGEKGMNTEPVGLARL